MLFRSTIQKELMLTSIMVFAAMMGIFIAQRVSYYIGLIARGTFPSDSIVTLMGFSMLRYLPTILSLSLFISILFTLTRQSRDNEMIIWFSSGMSISRWVSPVLSFAVPVVVIIAILSFFVTPWVASKGNEFQAQIKSKDDLASISPGVFKESQDANRVFFIESFDNLGNEVKNIFVQSSEKGKKSVIVAAKGYREKHANGDEFVVMEKGRRYEIEKNSAAVNTIEFERYGIRVQHKKVAVAPPSSQALSSLDLLQNRSNSNIAELHNRISLPLSSLILALLAIPLSYVDQRSGRSTNFMMAIMIFLIYNNLLNIMQAWLIQEKISLLIGMWPIHVLFIFFVGYLFYRRVNQKPFLPGMAS